MFGQYKGLKEKDAAVISNSIDTNTPPTYLRSHCPIAKNVKLSETDKLLESTLIGRSSVAKLLTEAETEILGLVVAGKSNKKIAEQLCRSERTVEYHRNRLMHKLGAHNIAELINRTVSARMSLP